MKFLIRFLLFLFFNSIISSPYVDELKIYSFKGSDSKDYRFEVDDDNEDDYFGSFKNGIIGKNPDWLIAQTIDSIYFYNLKDTSLKFELHSGDDDSNRELLKGKHVMYSPYRKNMYYLLAYNKDGQKILQSITFDPYKKKPFDPFPFISGLEYPQEYHITFLGNIQIEYAHISNHRYKNNAAYYLITKDRIGNYMIVTNNREQFMNYNDDEWYIYHSKDKTSENYLGLELVSKTSETDRLKLPIEIQTYMNNDDSIQGLITFISEENRQSNDIYYFCDLTDENYFSSDNGYQIFPRSIYYKENGKYYPFCSQYQPKFNFDGTKIAFLGKAINEDKTCPESDDLFDLWVFDVDKYNEEMCDANDYKGDFDGAYTKVDRLVQNSRGMDEFDNMPKDFVWHPNKNIIFYIDNGRRTESGEVHNSIRYYDVNLKEGGLLETNTKRNKYLSISDDGYLTFSFTSTILKPNKNNMPYLYGDCIQCTQGNRKIGVAKINIDE